MKTPIPVAFYDHTAKLSGGEISLLHLVTRMDRERFKALVILGEPGRLEEELRAAGIETMVLSLDRGVADTRKDSLKGGGIAGKLGAAFGMLGYIMRLRRVLRRRRVKLLHTNSLKSDLIAGLAGRLAFVPVVWHVRDIIDTAYLPGAAVKLMRKAARMLPAHVISISKAVEDSLELPASKPHTVVYNGIVPEAIPAPPDTPPAGPPRIAMVGRITKWKGQHIFIEAAAQLKGKYPDARYQIIGSAMFDETEYDAEIRALPAKLGVENSIEFLGHREDVPQLIQDVHVIVHSSITPEPFGKVVVEGMLAGKPVVATNGGGVPEIVNDGETGLLVPMGDAPAMAAAIDKLLADPPHAQTIGRQARQAALESFPISKTVAGVEDVFNIVLTK